jgi:hypothetical protein
MAEPETNATFPIRRRITVLVAESAGFGLLVYGTAIVLTSLVTVLLGPAYCYPSASLGAALIAGCAWPLATHFAASPRVVISRDAILIQRGVLRLRILRSEVTQVTYEDDMHAGQTRSVAVVHRTKGSVSLRDVEDMPRLRVVLDAWMADRSTRGEFR